MGAQLRLRYRIREGVGAEKETSAYFTGDKSPLKPVLQLCNTRGVWRLTLAVDPTAFVNNALSRFNKCFILFVLSLQDLRVLAPRSSPNSI